MARSKNTDRADARRRYRDQQRVDVEPNTLSEGVAVADVGSEPASRRFSFRLPDVGADIRALPGMFIKKPLLWVPFGLLLLGFFVVMADVNGFLSEGPIRDVGLLYAGMVLPPPPLIVPFIGGFLAPRASWLVGLLLGITYSLVITALYAVAPTSTETLAPGTQIAGSLAPLWGMSIIFGTLAGGFAAWYRGFLRSSQERARANRMAREKDQAEKAKDQARKDREALRASSRPGGSGSGASGKPAP